MLGIHSYSLGVVADNWSAATPSDLPGNVLGDPGATPHTKSAVTALIATPLAQPCYMVMVTLYDTVLAANDTSSLCDIMYDPAGGTAWSVLIPNLVCGFSPTYSNTSAPPISYNFPLYVPRGSSIGARWQTIRASPAAGTRVSVMVTLYGGPSVPGFWFGTKVTDIGSDTAGSAGLDHNPGDSGTYSAFASIGGTSNPSFGFVTIGAQLSAGSVTGAYYKIQYGFGDAAIPGSTLRYAVSNAEYINIHPPHYGCYCDIAAGTQMQVRATCSDTTSGDPSIVLYGVS